MSQVYPLDKVIRKVDAATKANFSNREKIVIIDSRSKEIISGWKRLVTGNLAYYLVANTNDAANITECKALICQLKDFANDREVTISINYQASCQPGNEEKVAQSLCGDHKPGEQLAEKIQSYIDKFSRSKAADFIENYSINKLIELQNFVQNEVTQEVGLKFDLRLSLANEEYLKPFSTGLIQFPVHVRDCTDDLDLQMQIELIVDEQNKIKALANFGKEVLLVNLVEEEVKKYLLENITLHRFCYELKNTVSNEVIAYLNKSQSLINKGRKVRFLSLASNSVSSLPEEIVEIQYDVECKYQGYPEPKPIFIKNTIQMLLNNIGKYRLAQSPNLEVWVKSKLERIVKPLLLYKEYIDILLDFEPIAAKIRADMEEAAKPLGYEIKHIVSRPNLKIIEVIKGFNIEIEETNLATKDANVKVKVSTFVAGKIENPREIKDYLSPDVDLEGLIKQAIHNAVREVLHSIEPERYYLRFYFPAVDEQGKLIEEKSVEQELIDKIKEVLEQSFYAKVSTIIPKPLNTEITERYQELYEKIGSFEFEVPSLNGDEAPVEFEGDFQIQGVEKNSWYIFQSRLPRINDIKQSIEKSLKAKLNTLDDEILQYTDTENLLLLEDFINQWINNPVGRGSIANQFGLEISIGNLSRSRTAIEESRSKVRQEMQHVELDDALAHLTARRNQIAAQKQIAAQTHEAKSLELSKLYEQRARILALPDNEDELEELNTKINDLVKEIPTPSLEEAKKKLNLLKPEKPKSKSLGEVTQQITRLTNKNNPAITSGSDIKLLGEDKKDGE
ncbi:hypothetical protein [Nostoc sp. ChiQUE01b]|uniref:hypothetical protein n=1 Tax=Nostoc sp. ChiQUE01b TaxID=3075376 RepID=UPI002AD54940|nr:hypothetical protein [Nostoc sp. ChiQUE01b]MDZ8260411.1 hypothetical protein [Nostoc sp. ChiQUE01b]